MQSFLLSPTQRILEWRNFRSSLHYFTEQEQLLHTAKFWAQVPLQTFALDYDDYKNWPTPWELVHNGDFDSTVVAILMEQTLMLSGWESSRLKLMYIKDTKIEDQMMTLLIDDRWLLNYSMYEIFDYSKIRNNCLVYAKYQIIDNVRVKI